jgi:hypothetical protein
LERQFDDDLLRQQVRRYLATSPPKQGTPEGDAHIEFMMEMGDLASTDPATIWRMIQLACDEPLSDFDLFHLSASLFEDLMGEHGAELLPQVADFTRRHPRMRLILATVWQGGMNNDVWEKVLSLREALGIKPL